ncbi:MAG: hypothetical protein WCF84_20140 [Anaerolineae bacterium]
MRQPTDAKARACYWALLVLLGLSLAGCSTIRPNPTPTWIPSPPEPTPLPQTSTPVAVNATPTPSPAPMPQILDVVPLRPGATWAYDVTLDYTQGGKTPIHWTGPVTETVTEMRREGSAVLFRVETSGHPLRTDQADNRLAWDVALGDQLYQVEGSSDTQAVETAQGNGDSADLIVQLPLETGRQWGDPQFLQRGDGRYVWRVETREDVTTPAGQFNGCFKLVFLTNPDDTADWLCPQVGIVRHEYHHHGSLLNEVWVLRSFSLPPG